jgi:hypothetical protein
MTNGQRIRSMSDEELAKWMYENEADAKIPYCANSEECGASLDNGIYPTKEMCIRCLCNYLKQQYSEVANDTD